VAIQTVTQRNNMCTRYAADAAWAAAYTTAPGGSAGTEPTGGSPAYARKAPSWGSPATSAVVASAIPFDIPSGTTIVGMGFHTAVTAGTYLDGAAVTSQVFSSQGVYNITPTYTQT
jgi:hypothetical protein